MFCATHVFPQEDCPGCLATVKAMRPSIFAELAAAELRSGTECCKRCDYVFFENIEKCPHCAEANPLYVQRKQEEQAWADTVPSIDGAFVEELDMLTLRDPLTRALLNK